MITLITGGSRSGKSRQALERMSAYSRKVFIATAEAIDPEMKSRIEKHRRDRDPSWVTVEEPVHLARAIRDAASRSDGILVDCLTFWLNNLFHYYPTPARSDSLSQEIKDFLQVLDERPASLVLVTNEVNMGVIPPDSVSRAFVDRQGWLNQEVARRADEVIFMVAGIPQVLKDAYVKRI